MYIEFNELPPWAQNEVKRVFGAHARPKTIVEPTETLTLGPVWHDAARRYVIARNRQGEMRRAESAYFDGLLNASPIEAAMHQGGSVNLHDGEYVLVVLTYPKQATLYTHPSNLAPLLPGKSDELSDFQAAILDAMNSLTSAGRKDTWQRYHVPVKLVKMVCQELASKGLVSIAKNGSTRITTKGRNICQQETQKRTMQWGRSYFYKWSECYDWQDRKFTGFAADVIKEYRSKGQG